MIPNTLLASPTARRHTGWLSAYASHKSFGVGSFLFALFASSSSVLTAGSRLHDLHDLLCADEAGVMRILGESGEEGDRDEIDFHDFV